jgi:ribosome-binding protein aMBF1 (putative translation factor)
MYNNSLIQNTTIAKLTIKLSLIVGCIFMHNITPEQLYTVIGKNVAKYRKDKGLSQLELSLQMGYKSVSVVSGSEVCYGNKHFNLEQLLKISQILDVDLCDFLKTNL